MKQKIYSDREKFALFRIKILMSLKHIFESFDRFKSCTALKNVVYELKMFIMI